MAGRGMPLWEFSVEIYGRRGVADACLALQDRHGVDVNMLLFCAWWAVHGGGRLSAVECDRASAAVAGWQAQVVVPLRAARRALKADLGVAATAAARLRGQIKDLELAAERLEQTVLEACLDAGRASSNGGREQAMIEAAAANMSRYLDRAAVRPGSVERDALAAILVGCFPAVARSAIDAAMPGPAANG